jgi:hypothetical protein
MLVTPNKWLMWGRAEPFPTCLGWSSSA